MIQDESKREAGQEKSEGENDHRATQDVKEQTAFVSTLFHSSPE